MHMEACNIASKQYSITLLKELHFLITFYCVFLSLYLLGIPKGSCSNQVLKSWTLDIYHNPLNKPLIGNAC